MKYRSSSQSGPAAGYAFRHAWHADSYVTIWGRWRPQESYHLPEDWSRRCTWRHRLTSRVFQWFSYCCACVLVFVFFFKAVKCEGYSRPRAKVQQHFNISESWFWRWQREKRERRIHKNKHNGRHSAHTHTHTHTVHTWTLQSKLWQTITPTSLPLTSTRLHPHSGSDPLYEALAKVQKQSVIWRGGEGGITISSQPLLSQPKVTWLFFLFLLYWRQWERGSENYTLFMCSQFAEKLRFVVPCGENNSGGKNTGGFKGLSAACVSVALYCRALWKGTCLVTQCKTSTRRFTAPRQKHVSQARTPPPTPFCLI